MAKTLTPLHDLDLIAPVERRTVLKHLAFASGSAVILDACKEDSKQPPAPSPVSVARKAPSTTSHQSFTDREFAVVEAACERIVPKDEDPGATDAHCAEYIDRMLAHTTLATHKAQFLTGVPAIDRRATRLFQKGFVECSPEQQDQLLKVFKESADGTGENKWYELLVVFTLEGFLGDPSYGGNKDKVGWKLVGFDLVGGQASAPPNGYDGDKQLRCGGGKGC